MKTTIELPDALFRQAKSTAAQEGKSLKDFFAEAVQMRLETKPDIVEAPKKPWEAWFGGLKHLHEENVRIQKLIDEEFSQINEETWR